MKQDQESQEQQSKSDARRKILLQQSRQSVPDSPVEQWVKEQLQQVYNDVVLEPVPQDFMNILKQIDKKTQ